MADNVIYYGPPGTGKTYFIQSLQAKYIDYNITDQQIKDAYMRRSADWLLITLIILQNHGKMSPADIQVKITALVLHTTINVSSVLETHNIASPMSGVVSRETPRIFFEPSHGLWYVDRNRLLLYDAHFIDNYLSMCDVEQRYDFVTFHQSFSYEDFIEGIRPTYEQATNTIDYSPKPGIFKQLCEKAHQNPEKSYAIFIDEINRGNVSEIFGELITLIELDKREGQPYALSAVLPYSKETFSVPNNLSIIGTMNAADRSIAAIDIALRRRFRFEPILPDTGVIERELELAGVDARDIDGVDLIALFDTINARIELLLDNNHLIGHSYFLKVRSGNDIADVIRYHIVPLLEEYFYDDLRKIQLIFNDLDADGAQRSHAIYCCDTLSVDQLFEFVGEYLLEDKRRYFVNEYISVDSLKQIYIGN